MALTLITGFVVGLLPAIRGSRGNLESTLRASAPAARGSYGRAPALLVILEVAFSMLLLLGAALMARTLVNLERIDPGFRPTGSSRCTWTSRPTAIPRRKPAACFSTRSSSG